MADQLGEALTDDEVAIVYAAFDTVNATESRTPAGRREIVEPLYEAFLTVRDARILAMLRADQPAAPETCDGCGASVLSLRHFEGCPFTRPALETERLREALIPIAARMARLEGGCESGHRAGQWHMHEEPYHATGREIARILNAQPAAPETKPYYPRGKEPLKPVAQPVAPETDPDAGHDYGHCRTIRQRARRLGHPMPECDCAAQPAAPETERLPWKSVALSLRGALRGICYDTTVRTIQDARAVALRAVTNADEELDRAAIEAGDGS